MTMQETAKLFAVAQSTYPEKMMQMPDEIKTGLLKSWHYILKDYKYEGASIALATYIKNDRYNRFPGVGQITSLIDDLKEQTDVEQSMSASEAWEKYVRPAIRDGLYRSEEHFAEMPDVVKEAIHSPSYLKELAMLPSETIDSVERSNFCNRMFKTAQQRRKDYARLPQAAQKLIDLAMPEATKQIEQAEDAGTLIEAKEPEPRTQEELDRIHAMVEEHRVRWNSNAARR